MVIAGGAGHYHCAQGEGIFHKGEDGDTVFVIESGAAQISLPQEGGPDIPLATLHAGDIFGELALFDTEPRSATVVAVEDMDAITIRRSDFLAFLRKEPDAAIQMLAVMAGRIRHTDRLLGHTSNQDLPVQLAKTLLALAKPMDEQLQEGFTPPLAVGRQQLLRSMGANKTLVDLYVQLLQQQGVLHIARDRIVISQKAALQELAETAPNP